ncbi:MAG: hypothetical protein JF887_02475 [Candidatus Dormibacteraeota bacterium]|uniref:Uncharacterized protein n=1 Tax=Candidatus Amunia macphersoniae TaxID=3127014 RepID=A0A934KKP9_9BACT|nr:hypothetical protein [Candidatus Dormibacteraeota bacterium]
MPSSGPANVIQPYATDVLTPLVPIVTAYGQTPASVVGEAPLVAALPLLGVGAPAIRRRRRVLRAAG